MPVHLILFLLTCLSMTVALFFVFIFAPAEATMGEIQRIFYFHVASAWTAFLAFFIVFCCSIAYLAKKRRFWDFISLSAAETGVLFMTFVLITGPLWAKPVWNTYWSWDARLTTSLILWLIYIVYLMIRKYTEDRQQGARFAAVFGIVAFIQVPIVYMSIRWWRTLHPAPVLGNVEGGGMETNMIITLLVSVLAFTMLFLNLLFMRYRIAQVEAQLFYLRENAE
ncbi:cytochrome C assembly protein [candidate division KSB1 bacterium]|nr:cytochrome C assembly protein [candidate division KSB1 bacterium]